MSLFLPFFFLRASPSLCKSYTSSNMIITIVFIYLTYSADSRRIEELAVALKEEVEKADWSFKTCGSFLRPGR